MLKNRYRKLFTRSNQHFASELTNVHLPDFGTQTAILRQNVNSTNLVSTAYVVNAIAYSNNVTIVTTGN